MNIYKAIHAILVEAIENRKEVTDALSSEGKVNGNYILVPKLTVDTMATILKELEKTPEFKAEVKETPHFKMVNVQDGNDEHSLTSRSEILAYEEALHSLGYELIPYSLGDKVTIIPVGDEVAGTDKSGDQRKPTIGGYDPELDEG